MESCGEDIVLDEIGQEEDQEEQDDVDGKELSTTRSGRRIRRRAAIDWLYY